MLTAGERISCILHSNQNKPVSVDAGHRPWPQLFLFYRRRNRTMTDLNAWHRAAIATYRAQMMPSETNT
jgi:hypothetical protein